MKNDYELTLRVIVLSILLTIILAVSNAYMALKIGILTSASIPAAILSMGILRFFKNSTILENNLVQTAASAGEAVAGGIVYTIPALIIIHYWYGFSYWENFWIALLGGLLGVLFSIPLRRFLVTDKSLPFPEGTAIAEVLKMSEKSGSSFRSLVHGGAVGAFIELCQTGFKIIASQWQTWWVFNGAGGNTIAGFGLGFSPTLIGAGYLVGYNLGLSILIGAILSWIIGIPIISQFFPDITHAKNLAVNNASDVASYLWSTKIRYVAIGTMLTGGISVSFSLIRPLVRRFRESVERWEANTAIAKSSHQQDIPWQWNLLGVFIAGIGLVILLKFILPLDILTENLTGNLTHSYLILFVALLYIFTIGFLFSGICGYFSGLVGVSASPGSAVIIAGMILIGFILLSLLQCWIHLPWTEQQTMAAEATAIIIGAIITGIACIANDNIQDLKVGCLLKASPWKQEVMLILGVITASLVIPPVMQILFEVYGIADVLPHAGMDPLQALPAPPAGMMAAVVQAVFSHQLPWNYLLVGLSIAVILWCIFRIGRTRKLSILGVGVGMYLPLSSSVPLFIGGWINHRYNNRKEHNHSGQKSVLLACGLLAGSALMDVILAIPFALTSSPNILSVHIFGNFESILPALLGIGIWVLLGYWFKKCNYSDD